MRTDIDAPILERYGRILQIRITATTRLLQVVTALVLEDLCLQGLFEGGCVNDEVEGAGA